MTGVDMYWHRVPADDFAKAQRSLFEQVPVYGAEGHEAALAEGSVVAVAEDYLLLEVLFAGGATPGEHAAGLVVSGGGWYPVDPATDDEIGLLAPDEVRAVAAYLDGAEPAAWIARREAELAAVLRGYSPHPWDERRAAHLAGHARALAAFYRRAADAGEAVVKVLVG
ncbi:hypothetical protein CS0771_22840 [Catellatospora sp. IY07-71]|uniref:DUF1877 family protein n=1 Tax=Catellatospora sp. IY07-71 TaxID=2728827 RepID=UPI001BB32A38|nr:DUF1877 family protein [Catellatospora sp. IY07-71]BCJ72740.1 hypothetical protein CS0771_22840 [Catellatospora sp. IY07-71]